MDNLKNEFLKYPLFISIKKNNKETNVVFLNNKLIKKIYTYINKEFNSNDIDYIFLCNFSNNDNRKEIIRNNIDILYYENFEINIFDTDIYYNKTEIIKEHERLSLNKYYGNLLKFPKILQNDKMVQYLNAKKNDIIKYYKRDSSIYYRLVV
mgnify:CR=1 FL=1